MKEIRESFVFHAEYISDLPDSYKAQFTAYTVNYGLFGEVPPVSENTLEWSLWVKIQRRIDAETEKYRAVSDKRREAARRRYSKRYGGSVPAKLESAETACVKAEAKSKTAEQSAAEKEKPKAEKFEKPTVEEVAEYCEERRNGIDARAFFDFYESKGWKVGAVKMRDWRASVRTWEQRRKTESTGGRTKPGGMWGNESEVPEEIADLF